MRNDELVIDGVLHWQTITGVTTPYNATQLTTFLAAEEENYKRLLSRVQELERQLREIGHGN